MAADCTWQLRFASIWWPRGIPGRNRWVLKKLNTVIYRSWNFDQSFVRKSNSFICFSKRATHWLEKGNASQREKKCKNKWILELSSKSLLTPYFWQAINTDRTELRQNILSQKEEKEKSNLHADYYNPWLKLKKKSRKYKMTAEMTNQDGRGLVPRNQR